jgi:hypothetical protein
MMGRSQRLSPDVLFDMLKTTNHQIAKVTPLHRKLGPRLVAPIKSQHNRQGILLLHVPQPLILPLSNGARGAVYSIAASEACSIGDNSSKCL